MEKLGPERAAQVPAVAAALRAPLYPNCYLSPTQFAEKFGLPKPEPARETPEKREREEEETGGEAEAETGNSDLLVPALPIARPTAEVQTCVGPQASPFVPPEALPDSPLPKPGIRPLWVFVVAALSILFGALAMAVLIAAGFVDLAAIGEQLRRFLNP